MKHIFEIPNFHFPSLKLLPQMFYLVAFPSHNIGPTRTLSRNIITSDILCATRITTTLFATLNKVEQWNVCKELYKLFILSVRKVGQKWPLFCIWLSKFWPIEISNLKYLYFYYWQVNTISTHLKLARLFSRLTLFYWYLHAGKRDSFLSPYNILRCERLLTCALFRHIKTRCSILNMDEEKLSAKVWNYNNFFCSNTVAVTLKLNTSLSKHFIK